MHAATEAILKRFKEDGGGDALNIGPALTASAFCALVRACKLVLPKHELTGALRRRVIAELVDSATRPAIADAIAAIDETVFGGCGDLLGRVGAAFAHELANALEVRVTLSALKPAREFATFYADLLTVADALDSNADARIVDIVDNLRRAIVVEAWMTGELHDVKTRADLNAWVRKREQLIRMRHVDQERRPVKQAKRSAGQEGKKSEDNASSYVVGSVTGRTEEALSITARIAHSKRGSAAGAPLNTLLDTGAEVTFVDAATARKHGLAIDTRSPKALTGLGTIRATFARPLARSARCSRKPQIVAA